MTGSPSSTTRRAQGPLRQRHAGSLLGNGGQTRLEAQACEGRVQDQRGGRLFPARPLTGSPGRLDTAGRPDGGSDAHPHQCGIGRRLCGLPGSVRLQLSRHRAGVKGAGRVRSAPCPVPPSFGAGRRITGISASKETSCPSVHARARVLKCIHARNDT